MTIYWERCSLCGRHYPTRACWLHPSISICPYCCLACNEYSICPNPVWYRKRKIERSTKTIQEAREAIKALEELLKRLEG